MERERHWEGVYTTKAPDQLSWYAPRLGRSLDLILGAARPPAAVIDVGGGASTLVDDLLRLGYAPVTVLDVSDSALQVSRARLGSEADRVSWVVGDVIHTDLHPQAFDVWHDRAAFHFLLDPADRAAYAARAARSVRPGGHLVIATFAPEGPEKCSGLEVVRYDGAGLQAVLGPSFRLESEERETHVTPWGAEQRFTYAVLERAGSAPG
jgi:SAM-dependent methyltransferase